MAQLQVIQGRYEGQLEENEGVQKLKKQYARGRRRGYAAIFSLPRSLLSLLLFSHLSSLWRLLPSVLSPLSSVCGRCAVSAVSCVVCVRVVVIFRGVGVGCGAVGVVVVVCVLVRGAWCGTLKTCVCRSETPPCVHSKSSPCVPATRSRAVSIKNSHA